MKQTLMPVLRQTKKAIPRSLYAPLIKPILMSTLNVLFGSKGAKIDIGGQGVFRFSPEYMFRGLENFGAGHNGGFAKCIQSCAGKSAFFDLGAHIGYYSLPASRALRAGGMVHAFEPDSNNFNCLSKHIRYNGIENIVLNNSVVGDSAKSGVEFYEHKVSGSPFGGLIVNEKKSRDAFKVAKKTQICLDEYCERHDVLPDVIKIDVEGGELGVLRGARNLLAKGNPKIFLSLHPSHLELMGQSVDEIIELLNEAGYAMLTLEENGPWKPGRNECICLKK